MFKEGNDMQFAASFDPSLHDNRDPDPWLALYLDRSIRLDDEAKAAMLLSMRSKSRQFLLPIRDAIISDANFKRQWLAGGPWQ